MRSRNKPLALRKQVDAMSGEARIASMQHHASIAELEEERKSAFSMWEVVVNSSAMHIREGDQCGW
jgi:hypothetical protein